MTKLMITQDEHNGRILLPCRKNKNKNLLAGRKIEWNSDKRVAQPQKKRIKED